MMMIIIRIEFYTDKISTTFLKNFNKKINRLRLWTILNHTYFS